VTWNIHIQISRSS